VLAASNAAAGASAQPIGPHLPATRPTAEAPRAAAWHEPVELVWFEPESVARIRRVPSWKQLIDEFNRRPLHPALDEGDAGKEPWEVEDRRELLEVLVHGEPSDAQGIEAALHNATQENGKFFPPVLLIEGEIELPFDELEALKAAVSAAAAMTPMDSKLRDVVDAAKEFLQTPGLSAPREVLERLTGRIREAFPREKKDKVLDTLMEQVLLSGRHYQTREVFGARYLRTVIRIPREPSGLIGYAPSDIARKLPMFRQFRGRVIAEVQIKQDQYETQETALRIVVLARIGGGIGQRMKN
jgi:hypothetical protein